MNGFMYLRKQIEVQVGLGVSRVNALSLPRLSQELSSHEIKNKVFLENFA